MREIVAKVDSIQAGFPQYDDLTILAIKRDG